MRETLSQTLRPRAPSADARQGILPAPGGGTRTAAVSPLVRSYLDLYPLLNGRGFGDGTAEFVNQSVRETRSVRYTFSDAVRGAPDPLRIWRFSTDSRYQFLHAETQHLISPHTIHTFRAAFSRVRNDELGRTRPDIPAALSY